MAKMTSLCARCDARCCRYIALPIETPETKDEFEDVRWYLAHEGIGVFVEKGDWYIQMSTPCRHIDAKNRCSIYEKRPKICRKYKAGDCDRSPGDYDYELHFTDDLQMEEYIKIKFTNNIKPKASRKPRKSVKKVAQ